jgi:hypothetical protein
MSDTFEHNKGDHEDPLPEATWMIGFISTVLLIVVFLGLVAVFYVARDMTSGDKQAAIDVAVVAGGPVTAAEETDFREKRTPIDKLKRVEQGILDAPPRWISIRANNTEVDRVLVVPIDDAMDLVVEESGR